jgi:hypothetical protein
MRYKDARPPLVHMWRGLMYAFDFGGTPRVKGSEGRVGGRRTERTVIQIPWVYVGICAGVINGYRLR